MQASRQIFQRLGILVGLLVGVLCLFGAALVWTQSQAGASSHREAPLISKDPFADNTDTYVFVSPDNPDNLVLVASWIPFEGPEGGPNYWEWDDNVAYDIHVDIDGDATSEVTYTLRSRVEVGNPNTFLYNTGSIDSPSSSNWNRRQFYTVTETFEPGTEPSGAANPLSLLVNNQPAAPVNIGSKSTPNYAALESATIYNVTASNGDAIKVFAGQTDDPFFVDLQVFDLLTLRGEAAPVGYSSGNNIAIDSLSGFNVHTMVIEVPISRLVRNNEPVLGVWAASRRPSMDVMGGDGEMKQVSRLGMPLVNEVVLPMGLKDVFNSIQPSSDLGAYGLLQKSVEDPEIGNLLCALYGIPLPGDSDDNCATEFTAGTPRTGRGDIFDVFLQGMVLANPFTIQTANGAVELPAGYNVNRPSVNGAPTPSEMIRINTNIKGDLCHPTPQRLGVLAGDACGFPNGRRLMDDVVEIELLAVAGAAYPVLDGRDASFSFNSDFIGVLTDNVNANDMAFRGSFPYVATAQSGQEHIHQNPLTFMLFPNILNAAVSVDFTELPAAGSALALLSLLAVPVYLWVRRRSA